MNKKGFTIIETLVYIFIFSLMLALLSSFLPWIFDYNSQTREKNNYLLGTSQALEFMVEKTRLADSIYYPTVTENQLSLEKNNTYFDFYSCEEKLCFKQEFKEPQVLLSDLDNLHFQLIEEQGVIIELNNLTTTIFLR